MSKSIPDNFYPIVRDLINDLDHTFPEYNTLLAFYKQDNFEEKFLPSVFEYCVKFFPERFFDILYQNEDIFSDNTNTHFLPHIDFQIFFTCEDVSEKTKQTLWKYLQLLLFSVIENVEDKSSFGEIGNMFEGIDEGELQSKLAETMQGISGFFENMSAKEEDGESTQGQAQEEQSQEKSESGTIPGFSGAMPNLGSIQEHLSRLFNGKIGALAKEMADELATDFTDVFDEGDQENAGANPTKIIQKLMKNPAKIMDLMKKVSSKLESKMASGEISKDEMMREAQTLLSQMKEMGGEQWFNYMLKQMASGMGGLGKNMKLDMNAIDRLTKQMSQREGVLKRTEQKKKQAELQKAHQDKELQERIRIQKELASKYSVEETSKLNELVFKSNSGDIQERSFIHPDLLKDILAEEENGGTRGKTDLTKKPKNKNKKNKKKKAAK